MDSSDSDAKMRENRDANRKISRRNVLGGIAMASTAAAFPGILGGRAFATQEGGEPTKAMTKPADSSKSVIGQLSSYMAEARDRALPAEALEKTKHHVIDTIAAMVSGAELPPGAAGLRFAKAFPGEKTNTIVGSGLLCGPIEAALVNGMLAHSDETDDSHAPAHAHPGCSILPAALACGEHFAITGGHFLRAVALGYDIGPRVMMTLGGLPFQMKTHRSSHNVSANFAAAAAAGCAAGLDARQMRFMLDYAAQQASGSAAWQRDTEHVEKALVFAGFPSRNGVTSALLIHLGATGVEDIFSGADNFLMAFTPDADPSGLVDKLGERFEVERTSIKKWTVGSPIQAPLDALQMIMTQHPFQPDELQKVVVRVATSEAKTVNNRDMPNISLQHMIAVMILDKTVPFQAAHDKARMKDLKVLQEKAKVQLVPDEELEKLYPKRETIVEVTLKDGKHYEQRVEAVRGTAENPMNREEVVGKARDLMSPFLGAQKTSRLLNGLLTLETMKDVKGLRPLLQRA